MFGIKQHFYRFTRSILRKSKPKKINNKIDWDLTRLLDAILLCWDVFQKTFPRENTRDHFIVLRRILRVIRNKTMHNDPLTHEEVVRALDIKRLFMQAIDMDADEKLKKTPPTDRV